MNVRHQCMQQTTTTTRMCLFKDPFDTFPSSFSAEEEAFIWSLSSSSTSLEKEEFGSTVELFSFWS